MADVASKDRADLTKTLLTCGIVAGPLFILLALAQAFTRDGFDIVRHPASLLSLGDLGWMQIANFVVTGLLFLAAAVGTKRVVVGGIGRRWIPILLGIFALGLIGGGVFTADAALGFPPGAPAGVLEASEWSWHGTLHAFMPVIAFTALVIAFFVLARRFAALKQRGWMAASILVGIATLVLSFLPNLTFDQEAEVFNFLPLWLGAILGLGYVSVIFGRLKAEVETKE